MVTAKSKPKVDIKPLGAVIVIGIIAIFGVLLYLNLQSSSPSGAQRNPYNASFGYQGQGYYAYRNVEFYAISQAQFNSSMSRVVPSATTNISVSTTNTTTDITPTTSIVPINLTSRYIYCVEGVTYINGGAAYSDSYIWKSLNNSYYSKLYTNGTPVNWKNTSKYPQPTITYLPELGLFEPLLPVCVSEDYNMYCLSYNTSYYSSITENGLSNWKETTPFPNQTELYDLSCAAGDRHMYCIAKTSFYNSNCIINSGYSICAPNNSTNNFTYTGPLYIASLSSNGIGNWITTTSVVALHSGVLTNQTLLALENRNVIQTYQKYNGSTPALWSWAKGRNYPLNVTGTYCTIANFTNGSQVTTTIINTTTIPIITLNYSATSSYAYGTSQLFLEKNYTYYVCGVASKLQNMSGGMISISWNQTVNGFPYSSVGVSNSPVCNVIGKYESQSAIVGIGVHASSYNVTYVSRAQNISFQIKGYPSLLTIITAGIYSLRLPAACSVTLFGGVSCPAPTLSYPNGALCTVAVQEESFANDVHTSFATIFVCSTVVPGNYTLNDSMLINSSTAAYSFN